MIMSANWATNQDFLCWRGPVAIYATRPENNSSQNFLFYLTEKSWSFSRKKPVIFFFRRQNFILPTHSWKKATALELFLYLLRVRDSPLFEVCVWRRTAWGLVWDTFACVTLSPPPRWERITMLNHTVTCQLQASRPLDALHCFTLLHGCLPNL
jgi:hypothetical protein